MKLELFNEAYFIYISIFFICLFGGLFLLKGKSNAFKTRFISSLLFFSLIVHFLKLLFPPYNTDELALRKITPENICALSTLIFPFIFLSQNKVLKDYMFYIGVLSGTLACFFPLEAIGKNAFEFDAIRFYICHIIITVAPFLMVANGLHKLDYHRVYKVPICFIIVFCIILINEIILLEVGLVIYDPKVSGYRNFSMVFGINHYANETIENILTFFTPDFLLRIPFGVNAGQKKYWPVLWAVLPMFVYITLLSFLLSIYWEKDHIKEDLMSIKKYFKYVLNRSKVNK